MTKKDLTNAVDNVLANVNNGRRGFLKGMLVGGAVLASLPLITSTAVGQTDTTDTTKKKKKKGTDTTGARQ